MRAPADAADELLPDSFFSADSERCCGFAGGTATRSLGRACHADGPRRASFRHLRKGPFRSRATVSMVRQRQQPRPIARWPGTPRRASPRCVTCRRSLRGPRTAVCARAAAPASCIPAGALGLACSRQHPPAVHAPDRAPRTAGRLCVSLRGERVGCVARLSGACGLWDISRLCDVRHARRAVLNAPRHADARRLVACARQVRLRRRAARPHPNEARSAQRTQGSPRERAVQAAPRLLWWLPPLPGRRLTCGRAPRSAGTRSSRWPARRAPDMRCSCWSCCPLAWTLRLPRGASRARCVAPPGPRARHPRCCCVHGRRRGHFARR